MAIKVSLPEFTVKYDDDLKSMLKVDSKNWVSFDLGVKSVN